MLVRTTGRLLGRSVLRLGGCATLVRIGLLLDLLFGLLRDVVPSQTGAFRFYHDRFVTLQVHSRLRVGLVIVRVAQVAARVPRVFAAGGLRVFPAGRLHVSLERAAG